MEKYKNDFSITVRTKAYDSSEEDILSELNYLTEKYNSLIQTAHTRTKNFLLYEAEKGLMSLVRDSDYDDTERIVTDDKDIYDMLINTGLFETEKPSENTNSKPRIELYEDKMLPLYNL